MRRDAGVTIKRTGYDTTALTNQALLAAQQGNSPDVLIVDNPVVSTLAEAGVLTTTDEDKLDTSAIAPNLLARRARSAARPTASRSARTPSRCTTTRTSCTAAGVDPATIKDWASLTAALAKVKAAGKKGITFSAIGTEEGSFQFLPWFWGSGANLTKLDSPEGGRGAVTLWTDWLKKGYAPNSVINNTQTTSWQEFATGEYAFAENGTWQLANAEEGRLRVRHHPDPGAGRRHGAGADRRRVRHASRCRRTPARYADVAEDRQLPDRAPTTRSPPTPRCPTSRRPTAVQAKQVAANPELKVWVDAVKAAKGRTSDNLGTKYPKISAAAVDRRAGGAERVEDAAGRAGGRADGSRRRSRPSRPTTPTRHGD